MIDVISSRSLHLQIQIYTNQFGVFSCLTNYKANQAYLGCYGGHFYVVNLPDMSLQPAGHLQVRQGIYDMTLLPDKSNNLILCQHFGFIDIVNPVYGQLVYNFQLPTNSIFKIKQTKTQSVYQHSSSEYGPWEYAIGTLTGLYFIQVSRTKNLAQVSSTVRPPLYRIDMEKETYFKGKNVSAFHEYQPGLYVICLAQDN